MDTRNDDHSRPKTYTKESKLSFPENNLEDRWNRIRDDYREQYPSITDTDVSYRTGEFDDMLHRIARRTNRTRTDIENDIRNWKNDNDRS